MFQFSGHHITFYREYKGIQRTWVPMPIWTIKGSFTFQVCFGEWDVILSKSSARPNSDNAIPKPNKRKRFPDVDTGNG
jgi:hypothetical protein